MMLSFCFVYEVVGFGVQLHVANGRRYFIKSRMFSPASQPIAACWNQRITAIPTSTWREVSGQEQQERMHVTEER